jgi:hypothetical protein
VGFASKFLWGQRLVSEGGPKSFCTRLWDADVKSRGVTEPWGFVGKRLVGDGGPRSCFMRFRNANRKTPRRLYHSLLVGNIVHLIL